MEAIMKNIQGAIKEGLDNARQVAQITEAVTLRHKNCKNPDCRVCMDDLSSLGRLLEELTGNHRVDHLGKYHSWLSRNGISPETEWGWATEECFDAKNIKKYIDEFKGENE